MAKTVFVKSGFSPAEILLIDSLIEEGIGRSRSDIMRLATMIFVNNSVELVNIRCGSDKVPLNGDGCEVVDSICLT